MYTALKGPIRLLGICIEVSPVQSYIMDLWLAVLLIWNVCANNAN